MQQVMKKIEREISEMSDQLQVSLVYVRGKGMVLIKGYQCTNKKKKKTDS